MSVRVACIADVHFQLKARKGNETGLPFYCLHAKSPRLENEKETSATQASVRIKAPVCFSYLTDSSLAFN